MTFYHEIDKLFTVILSIDWLIGKENS